MANESIGVHGGKYRTRFKKNTGDWSPWLNLGGGLKVTDVEVELVEEASESAGTTWNALLDYVLENRTEDPMVLLRLWREGSFDEIRSEWPGVPEAIFPKAL